MLLKKIFALLLVLLTALAALMAAMWSLPLTNRAEVKIEIDQGDTLGLKAGQWQAQGWLPSASLLRMQARVLKKESLRAGEFMVPPGLDGPAFLSWLETAKPLTYKVRFIEGTRLDDALNALRNAHRLRQDINPLTAESVAHLLGIDGNPEGLLFPDTYVYQGGEAVSAILRQSFQRMQIQLQSAWEHKSSGLPYKTPYEALIMASIVEKETSLARERPQIAGVFVRRLQKGMRLETDPTVIYGLGAEYNGDLRKRHLQDAGNPYNTYRVKGLPPTPIALAGREALDAALNPADGKALFFVARGDGSHVFSATLAEHNAAVNQYQILNRPRNYRSTPADDERKESK